MGYRMNPSRWLLKTGHSGLLMGRSLKLKDPPNYCQTTIIKEHTRLSCVSRYEKLRPCKSGSSEKSIPGTMLLVQNATCSVSGKYSSTFRFNSISPIYLTGTKSSGQIFVASRM